MNFSRPLSVSTGSILDKVAIILPVYFTKNNSQEKELKWFRLRDNLPMLIGNATELKKLTGISKTLEQGSCTFLWIYMICNILFSFALGMLWGTF